MAFQRAAWHSSLTYKQKCRMCRITLQYTDDSLDFRPWFPNGFVYCPRCHTPLRHHETYAINDPEASTVNVAPPVEQFVEENGELARFCAGCGNPYAPDDRFCAHCGTKR